LVNVIEPPGLMGRHFAAMNAPKLTSTNRARSTRRRQHLELRRLAHGEQVVRRADALEQMRIASATSAPHPRRCPAAPPRSTRSCG
jgi:hypothetical protein